jgi:integrase
MEKRRWDSEFKDMYQTPNDIWYVRYWSPKLGREIEKSLRTTIKIKAVKARKKLLEDIGEEKDKYAVGYKKFSQVIAAFKADAVWEAEATEKTALNQLDNHILPWFGNYDPDRLDNSLWRKYADERRKKDPDCSLHNARKYLWKVCNWAFEKRIVKKKFTPDDFDGERKSPGIALSDEQFLSIRARLNQDWRDLADIVWSMGFRVSEIKQLEWSRVDFVTGEITLEAEHTKTRKARKPVMTQKVREILLRRKSTQESSGLSTLWVFPGKNPKHAFSKSDRAWQLAKDKAGVECRFHDLRHTWLTRAFKATNRYAEICEYAGLSLEEALETYVKFNRDDMAAVAHAVSNSFSKVTGEIRGKNLNV